MAIISFAIVLVVGFWKHGLHFFSLFVPHGTPFILKLADRADRVGLASWSARSASALRLFVAMIAGHILLEVFGNFIVQGLNAEGLMGSAISAAVLRLHRRRQSRSSCWSARSRPMSSPC